MISLLDINSHHSGESATLLEGIEGAVFDEDAFRLTRRFGRSHNSGASGSGLSSTNLLPGNLSDALDGRKNSYRLREQRWYDSYREEIFSNAAAAAAAAASTSSLSSSHLRSNNQGDQQRESQFNDDASNRRNSATMNTYKFGETLEFWTEKVRKDLLIFHQVASFPSQNNNVY